MEVYHASATRGLTVIEPRPGTHGTWVYASKDPVMASLFVSGLGGDFTCQIGRDPSSGLPYVCERFRGAFEHRYLGRQGSVYVLAGEGFLPKKTPWSEEVVSAGAAQVIREIVIEDAAAYLLDLANQKALVICRYPRRIDDIPEDDQDLVEKAVRWTRIRGPKVLAQFSAYHPHLARRVQEALRLGTGEDGEDGSSG